MSKRRRLDSGDIPNLKENEGSVRFADNVLYRFYFKGLVSEDVVGGERRVTAGFGVAICDHADNLLYEIKESVVLLSDNRKEVEIKALIRGLTQAFELGIRHVWIYCDDYQIIQFINGGAIPKQSQIAQLVGEVRHLRAKMASCEPLMVARNDVKFAFKLAREAIVSQSSGTTSVDAQGKETCGVCLEEIDAKRMFFTEKCLHRHCFSCVKQFVEVKLLSGVVPTCLAYECNIELTLESCSKILTARVIDMWKLKNKEDSIPVTERFYCPYPSCSMLMSKTELLSSADSSESDQYSNVRACVKCCGLFCIDCKVPSHPDLSCAEYKKLHPDPLVDDMKLNSLANDNRWRQCVKCRHLIERSQGCNHMTCRCGYEFCYKCGTEWKKNQQNCPSGCRLHGNGDYDDEDDNDSEHTCETDMCECYYDAEGGRWRNFEDFVDHQPHDYDFTPQYVEAGEQHYEQFFNEGGNEGGSEDDYNYGGLTPDSVGGFDEAFYIDYYSL